MIKTIIAPFSIDTPIFELLQNENATKVLIELLPDIYDSASGENSDTQYSSIRQVSEGAFSGISNEILEKCQEELSKIKVLNYTSPDVTPTDTPTDEPTDEPFNPTDDNHTQFTLLKFNQLLICFIILIWF